jgi:hypothetical protein
MAVWGWQRLGGPQESLAPRHVALDSSWMNKPWAESFSSSGQQGLHAQSLAPDGGSLAPSWYGSAIPPGFSEPRRTGVSQPLRRIRNVSIRRTNLGRIIIRNRNKKPCRGVILYMVSRQAWVFLLSARHVLMTYSDIINYL